MHIWIIIFRVVSFLSPLSVEDLSDNTAINIVQHGDKVFAMTDMSVMNEVDPQTLLVKNKVSISIKLLVLKVSSFTTDLYMLLEEVMVYPCSQALIYATDRRGRFISIPQVSTA